MYFNKKITPTILKRNYKNGKWNINNTWNITDVYKPWFIFNKR